MGSCELKFAQCCEVRKPVRTIGGDEAAMSGESGHGPLGSNAERERWRWGTQSRTALKIRWQLFEDFQQRGKLVTTITFTVIGFLNNTEREKSLCEIVNRLVCLASELISQQVEREDWR